MPIKETKIGTLPIYVFEDRSEMGQAAGKRAAAIINEAIAKKGEANVIFAAAPSQADLLDALLTEDVDWTKVRGFHQDEYIGLAPNHPAGFGNFMQRYIFDKLPFMELHYLRCAPEEAEAKCEEYSALLRKYPPDLIFLGVGENGHLAFNDPQVADFSDKKQIKVVELDLVCRTQQVNDGCFESVDEVPTHALTLTMSQILSVPKAIAVVPTALKADAIKRALSEEISTDCPASVLRRYEGAELYLDKASAQKAFEL